MWYSQYLACCHSQQRPTRINPIIIALIIGFGRKRPDGAIAMTLFPFGARDYIPVQYFGAPLQNQTVTSTLRKRRAIITTIGA